MGQGLGRVAEGDDLVAFEIGQASANDAAPQASHIGINRAAAAAAAAALAGAFACCSHWRIDEGRGGCACLDGGNNVNEGLSTTAVATKQNRRGSGGEVHGSVDRTRRRSQRQDAK